MGNVELKTVVGFTATWYYITVDNQPKEGFMDESEAQTKLFKYKNR